MPGEFRDDTDKINELLIKMDRVIEQLNLLIYFKKERWWEKFLDIIIIKLGLNYNGKRSKHNT